MYHQLKKPVTMPIIMITIIIDIEYIHKIYFKTKTKQTIFPANKKSHTKLSIFKTKTIVMNAEIKAKKNVERLKERKTI